MNAVIGMTGLLLGTELTRRAARVRRGRALERRRAAARDRRHPRLLEDRGRQARARARAGRPPRVRRGRARHRRAARLGEADRARLPDRRGRSGGNRRRRGQAPAGAAQPALERGQVHRGGRGRRRRRRRAHRRGLVTGSRSPSATPGSGSRRIGWTALFDVVQPGRRLDDAPLRRHRARARDLEAPRRADGRHDAGRERGGQGLDLPDRARRRRRPRCRRAWPTTAPCRSSRASGSSSSTTTRRTARS